MSQENKGQNDGSIEIISSNRKNHTGMNNIISKIGNALDKYVEDLRSGNLEYIKEALNKKGIEFSQSDIEKLEAKGIIGKQQQKSQEFQIQQENILDEKNDEGR